MDYSKRISREEFFIEVLNSIKKRSTCIRKQVGALLVKDNRIIAMGYNGVLPGVDPMDGVDPITGESKTVHAEANIISFCAKNGISTEGCKLYISLSPCIKCAELIVQAGIKEVSYIEEYRDPEGVNVLKRQFIPVKQL